VIGEALKQRDEKIAALEARLAVLEAAAAPRREARSEDLP